MTLANLIVNVEANTVKLTKDVEQINSQMDKIVGVAGKVAGTLGIAFSAQALIGFGQELLADADLLTKLHDKTAITLQDLQRMRIAGDDAGVSLEDMAGAVNKLQKNLGSGNEGATAALKALHLDLRDIRALTPEQQFYEIASALKDVKDPAQQVALAIALFGKNGAELLPVIKRGFDDVKHAAVGMSDDTIKNLDAVGDAFAYLWRGAKAVFANIAVNALHPDLFGMRAGAAALEAAGDAAAKMAPKIAMVAPHEVEINVREIERALDDERKRLDDVRKSAEKAAEVHKHFKEELERHTEAARKNEAGLVGLHDTVGLLNTSELDSIKVTLAAADAFKKLEEKVYDVEKSAWIAEFGFQGMTDGLENLGAKSTELDDVRKRIAVLSDDTGTFSSVLRGMPNLLIQAFTGGGGLSGAIQALGIQLQGAIIGPIKEGMTAIEKKTIAAMNAAISFGTATTGAVAQASGLNTTSQTIVGVGTGLAAAALGAHTLGTGMTVAATLGTAGMAAATLGIGLAAVGVAVLIKKWWDHRKEVKENTKSMNEFVDTVFAQATAGQVAESGNARWALTTIMVRDAYLATGRSAADAERDVAAMWASTEQGAAASKAAIDKINLAFTEQKQDAADLDAAIQKYGFTIEQLGPAMQRQKLTEQAMTLINDFRLLAGSGIDVNTVLDRMGGSINEFVQTALRTGQEIPSHMKPMLEKMIEMGTLTDASGNAITDLNTSGLTFSETMTQGFDRIIKKFDQLLSKIGLLPAAAAAAANGVPDNPFADWVVPDMPTTDGNGNYAASGGFVTDHGIQHFANGGSVLPFRSRGTDTVPAMLTPGEMVLTKSQQRRVFGGGGGNGNHPDDAALRAEVQGLRADLRRDRVFMRETLVTVVKSAVRQRVA